MRFLFQEANAPQDDRSSRLWPLLFTDPWTWVPAGRARSGRRCSAWWGSGNGLGQLSFSRKAAHSRLSLLEELDRMFLRWSGRLQLCFVNEGPGGGGVYGQEAPGVSQAEAPARHLSCCFALRIPLPSLVQCARVRPCGGERLVVSRRPVVPALPLTSCGTADTNLNLSEFQPIYLKNRGTIYNLLASLKNTVIACITNVPVWVPRPQDVDRTHSEVPGGPRCPPAPMPPPWSGLEL